MRIILLCVSGPHSCAQWLFCPLGEVVGTQQGSRENLNDTDSRSLLGKLLYRAEFFSFYNAIKTQWSIDNAMVIYIITEKVYEGIFFFGNMLIMIAFVSRPHTNCVYWFCAARAQLWENGRKIIMDQWNLVEYHGKLNVFNICGRGFT